MGERPNSFGELDLPLPDCRADLSGIPTKRRPGTIGLKHVFQTSAGIVQIGRELVISMRTHFRYEHRPSRRDLLTDVVQNEPLGNAVEHNLTS